MSAFVPLLRVFQQLLTIAPGQTVAIALPSLGTHPTAYTPIASVVELLAIAPSPQPHHSRLLPGRFFVPAFSTQQRNRTSRDGQNTVLSIVAERTCSRSVASCSRSIASCSRSVSSYTKGNNIEQSIVRKSCCFFRGQTLKCFTDKGFESCCCLFCALNSCCL